MNAVFPSPQDGLARILADAIGADRVLTVADQMAPYLAETRGLYRGAAEIVLLPRSTEEVATAMALCAAAGVSVVPQGGNTGLVGGAVAGPGQVLVSLARMNRVLSVDPVDLTMTVEAGAILQNVQEAARERGCLFPLSLGAEGSCQIGGNISTNAGGINVLRYGNMRDLVLGLEVVLPDGRIWNGMRALHKDNTGYALKHLFIGAEGTLGIVTRAVMKLFPQPDDRQTALCAVETPADALALLGAIKQQAGENLTAFELISAAAMGLSCQHSGMRPPIDGDHPWLVLIELTGSSGGADLAAALENCLAGMVDAAVVADAVVAQTLEHAAAFWRLRERIPEAQQLWRASVKHDVSVPISRVPQFLAEAEAAVSGALPGVKLCVFGHLGDGNLHYNLSPPDDMDSREFLARGKDLTLVVHDVVHRLNGSISAEHGIGQLKASDLQRHKDPVELELMQRIKTAFDPDQRMNPGKIFAATP